MRPRAIAFALILGVAACGSATSGDTTNTTAAEGDTTVTEAPSTTAATAQSTTTTLASTTSTTAASSTTTTAAATTTTAQTTSTTAASTTTTTRATTTTTRATTTTQAAKTVEVEIESFQFTPANITIKVGDSIRWVTTSGTHTSTSTGAWDTGVLATGESAVIEYDQPGTFTYFCSIHPGMQGTVTVES